MCFNMIVLNNKTNIKILTWISITSWKSERARIHANILKFSKIFLKFSNNFMTLYYHWVCQNPQKQTHGENSRSTTFLVLLIIHPNISVRRTLASPLSSRWFPLPVASFFSAIATQIVGQVGGIVIDIQVSILIFVLLFKTIILKHIILDISN